MLRIVTLLQQKNHYLEKFYALNEQETENFKVGRFDSLEDFYQTRENILQMIKYIDQQIDEEPSVEPGEVSNDDKNLIREALAIRDQYVSRIISQDLEVLECIETAKSNIIKELQEIQKNRRTMSKFKSPSFNNRLNEKV